MDVVDITRLQFAVVTIYHYLFVPLSISLASLTAGLQTASVLTRDPERAQRLRRSTLLVGKLLLVTFAVGVVTGLVQEFQFGMGWSAFARFYGDVFGPTLAIEGMLAFFLEATFLGLWFFGWDRLPRLVHLATIWVVAIGTLISAYVILGANSFMQHPVAYQLDPSTGRAHLSSFTELMTNPVLFATFPHTIAGAAMLGGALLLSVGSWRRWIGPAPAGAAGSPEARAVDPDQRAFAGIARLGAWTTVAGGLATALTGDTLGKVMTSVQPMKMAAAEALYTTTTGAPFSLLTIGNLDGSRPIFSLDLPYLLSFLATGEFHSTVQGIDDLQAQYSQQFGPGDYAPVIPLAYWSFRAMITIGLLAALVAGVYLWLTRKGLDPREPRASALPFMSQRLFPRPLVQLSLRMLPTLPLLPAAAGTAGWVFTETARQPWLAFGLTLTKDGVSPGLTAGEAWLSLAAFTAVYGVLAVVWLRLVKHLVAQDLTDPPVRPAPPASTGDDDEGASEASPAAPRAAVPSY
ncbi:cytochrome ubiquinol oxidase subunit I [Quadrisphaera setariae]|uniref:Cytochrome ubiquinol oxidase subunit I n=1 Tax=Quadrisphaera setariae TaxID=2593304 RepID=A0A5C8ZED5_9ACTN|nr:cytochrome ubiquinol oxidase subunit I [Quadrisphaera setariae]TXR55659.1 cytochrome ubiquinol oxidase subunit I [Quadrisphaera setariae]